MKSKKSNGELDALIDEIIVDAAMTSSSGPFGRGLKTNWGFPRRPLSLERR